MFTKIYELLSFFFDLNDLNLGWFSISLYKGNKIDAFFLGDIITSPIGYAGSCHIEFLEGLINIESVLTSIKEGIIYFAFINQIYIDKKL